MKTRDTVKYVGADRRFLGCTALAKVVKGTLYVQVTQFENMWSYGWHPTSWADWRAC